MNSASARAHPRPSTNSRMWSSLGQGGLRGRRPAAVGRGYPVEFAIDEPLFSLAKWWLSDLVRQPRQAIEWRVLTENGTVALERREGPRSAPSSVRPPYE
jgi:hypothetical protein